MTRLQLTAFAQEHVPGAARLLADRHRAHRRTQPLLDARFEDVAVCEAELVEAVKADDASGAVATRGGRLVGYLLGAPKRTDTWGPNAWVESAGQAVAADEPAELIRDVYGLAATRWVEEGRTAHYVLAPSSDRALVEAWFRLAFGNQHSHAIRPVPSPAPTSSTGPRAVQNGVTVRRARRDDIPVLARLELELPAHQGLSPVFSAGPVPSLAECEADWREDFDDPDYTTFVAEHDGQVIGSAVGCALQKSSSHQGPAAPENAGFLGFAAVLPEARGRGAGRALGEAVLWWAAETGHASVVTDWRTTNLLSSRAWPALGFTETFTRLHRVVGF
jgi:GNAT superfamily N-acetyltransferase